MISGKKIREMEEGEHREYHRRLLYVAIVLLLFLFGGATFYYYAEKWRYIDALYFTAATMTTVGYGDLTPKTDVAKAFTIIFVFAGVAIALYGLSILASHFVEVREEFWLRQLGKIKLKDRTQTFWDKLKGMFVYSHEELTNEYEKSVKGRK